MTESLEDFAEQLGRYLERVGFTQQELANRIGMHRNTIVKWLNRTSVPTHRGQVLRLADELTLGKEERKALLQAAGFSLERWPTEVWMVPQQQDMFFTGRDEVFRSLRELLVPRSTTALTQAISGLGGIGKTHTAVEYAYRFHRDYEAVLWLQADSWEALVSACTLLVDELALPEQKEADQVVPQVQRWLRTHRSWLLILDNVEHPQEILPRFVPTQHQGSVLITTCVHDVEPLASTQVLATMSEEEGMLFLLRRAKKVAAKAGLAQVRRSRRRLVRSGSSWTGCHSHSTRPGPTSWRRAVRSPRIASCMLAGGQNSWIGGASGSSVTRRRSPSPSRWRSSGSQRSTRLLP